jgi:hypothetical protein
MSLDTVGREMARRQAGFIADIGKWLVLYGLWQQKTLVATPLKGPDTYMDPDSERGGIDQCK